MTVIGIDVGGAKKGFHAVALTNRKYRDRIRTTEIRELKQWCVDTVRAQTIAVDAPCGWSQDGHSRPAERQLMKKGIWCFSTPTRKAAKDREARSERGETTNHYGWMLRGEALYRALMATHPISDRVPGRGDRCCFESFPHAITWHLRAGNANAKRKRVQRNALLKAASIELGSSAGIDDIDAALCALTAHHAATGMSLAAYGEPETGLIMVPSIPN